MRKEIAGYEGLYAVDDKGNVWSLRKTSSRRPGELKPYANSGGHLRVNLYRDKKIEHRYVHRLVAEAFIPNPERHEVVNHIDANPRNNCVGNLEWCSQAHNVRHSRSLGNQNDIPVKAMNQTTGEVRKFQNLKDAGIELFGKWWALRYHQQKKGKYFSVGGWDFEVMKVG